MLKTVLVTYTQEDINFTADNDVNITAGENLNIVANKIKTSSR